MNFIRSVEVIIGQSIESLSLNGYQIDFRFKRDLYYTILSVDSSILIDGDEFIPVGEMTAVHIEILSRKIIGSKVVNVEIIDDELFCIKCSVDKGSILCVCIKCDLNGYYDGYEAIRLMHAKEDEGRPKGWD
jgi:hypothetical protein